MRNKILFIIFSLIIINVGHVVGQKKNNIWLTGIRSGIDFNTNPRTPLNRTKAYTQHRGYATSVCDKDGNLLFHTNGDTVYAKTNYILPRLYRWPWTGIKPLHVIPLICPQPGSDSLFYLFGIGDEGRPNELFYIRLDKDANFGAGDFVYPTSGDPNNYVVSVLKSASILLAGTQQCNKRDYWIVAHSNSRMYSFSLTSAGLSSTAVVSAPIPVSMESAAIYNQDYNLKFSANGEKLVLPNISKRTLIVFDFNNMTGVFSNPTLLKTPKNLSKLQDVELSPDGSKLYFAGAYTDEETFATIHDIYQMDLSAGPNAADIELTTVKVSPYPERLGVRSRYRVERSMNVGPDGLIYVNGNSFDMIANIIQDPNEPGKKANYRTGALSFSSMYENLNYNYIRSESFSPKQNGIVVRKSNCENQPVELGLFFKSVDSVKWDLGDPASGGNNFPATVQVEHTYPGAGTYTAKAIIYHHCFTDTAVTSFEILSDKALNVPEFKDTVVCKGQFLTLDAYEANATSYLWSDGQTTPKVTFKVAGPYFVVVKNACSEDSRSFSFKIDQCDCEIFIPNAFTPNNDGLNDIYRPVVKCSVNQYSFKVFNRYGNVVFSTGDHLAGWNGYVGSSPGAIGTYICLIQYRDPNNDKFITKKEFIELVR